MKKAKARANSTNNINRSIDRAINRTKKLRDRYEDNESNFEFTKTTKSMYNKIKKLILIYIN